MDENQQQPSPFILILKKVWPFINRVINTVIYFILGLIKTFFKYAVRMIKGEF